MTNYITHVEAYIDGLPEDRRVAIIRLMEVLKTTLPKGFESCISYGMIGFVVPHSIYPSGYHCNPKLPLPFINIASQKNYISVYHMGLYANAELYSWFNETYENRYNKKLKMGKSCMNFKTINEIPFDVLSELFKKMTVFDWIICYEKMKSKPNN